MKTISDDIKSFEGENPFGDYQGRNFSDEKVCSEFYPISTFWSLFNDQHEIILGSRGSGKTFLLKMMRYSMLKNVKSIKAENIIKDKKYISLYVPMHLEFIASYTDKNLSVEKQVELFQTAFNCLLAKSLLNEINEILNDITDIQNQIKLKIKLAKSLNRIWFSFENTDIYDLNEISHKIDAIFYNLDHNGININAPEVFKRQICTSLLSVKSVVEECLSFSEPTWIICIDEAEFLSEELLKCINNVFRSDSNRIALKVATLPFYHSTLDTLVNDIRVNEGNDFNYRLIDMDYSSNDFTKLTNKICYERLRKQFDYVSQENTLENFLGVVGNDDLIDYYRLEVGAEKSNPARIESEIINNFSEAKQIGAITYSNRRKTIYDKYAPIYFLREMYKISNKGNSVPGWYAGAKMVRRISQGNPRLFIHLMNELFEKAKNSKLTQKIQHGVVYNFCKNICGSTIALESQGPVIDKNLSKISNILHDKTHNGSLIAVSSSFYIAFRDEKEFIANKLWIELAIAHSRLFVDDEVKKHGLSAKTKFCLANIYAVKYWLPMRKDTPTTINISDINSTNSYNVRTKNKKTTKKYDNMQITFLEEE